MGLLFAAIGGVDEGLLERSERAGRRTRASIYENHPYFPMFSNFYTI